MNALRARARNVPLDSQYARQLEIVREACSTSDETQLEQLLAANQFDVNGPPPHDLSPLITAVQEESEPIAKWLLDNGANPNVSEGLPLRTAINNQHSEMVKLLIKRGASFLNGGILVWAIQSGTINMLSLLLEQGADLSDNDFSVITYAIKYAKLGRLMVNQMGDHPKRILEFLLSYAEQLGKKRGVRLPVRRIGRFANLYLAIFRNDTERVRELVNSPNFAIYYDYKTICDDQNYRPAYLACWFSNADILEIFVRAGVDIDLIFPRAVTRGNLEVVKLCLANVDFDPKVRNKNGETAMHIACRSGQIEMVKILSNQWDLEAKDKEGRTPVFQVKRRDIAEYILNTFPEVRINLRNGSNHPLLFEVFDFCELLAIFLEHGLNPEFKPERRQKHSCNNPHCNVVRYLQKICYLDTEYVRHIIPKLLTTEFHAFMILSSPQSEEYKAEMAKMENCKISFTTSFMTGKNLCDFICMGANEAVRFARNRELMRIYEDNHQDFRNLLPHYGFALNHQFRRIQVKKNCIQEIQQLAVSILEDVPDNFAELIFVHFSNDSLKQFSL